MHYSKLLQLYGLHLFLMLLCWCGLRLCLGYPVLPAAEGLLSWDAAHYFRISRQGYKGINVAFFPLFPALWRLLSVNAIGICLVNIAFFYGSLTFLAKLLKLSAGDLLLLLSVPSFLFFYVPYTEALFLLGSVCVLYGLQKSGLWWLLIGLLLLSLTRSVVSVVLPAFMLTCLLKRQDSFFSAKTALAGLATIMAGVGLVTAVQYWQTGEWFPFITVHKSFWNHYLRLPELPLYSWENSTRLVLLLDGAALAVAMLCGFRLVQVTWRLVTGEAVAENGGEIFSLLYLLGCGAAILLFQGGNLMSINRYVFPTAYFIVVFRYWSRRYTFDAKHILYAFGSFTLFWLLFKSYSRLNTFLRLELASAYFSSVLLVFASHKRLRKVAFAGFYLLNTLGQVYCLHVFLNQEWIG